MLRITKTAFIYSDWHSDVREYIEEEISPIRLLREGVTSIDDDVTLGDIIILVATHPFYNQFIGDYSSCDVDAFYKELQRSTIKSLDQIEDCTFCTVSLQVEVSHRDSTQFKSLPEHQLEYSWDFHGRGSDKDGEEQRWGLSLSPLSEIAALPVRLLNNALVCEMQTDYQSRKVDHLECRPTLLEFLDTIFFDISFHGSPANKADVSLSLLEAVKSIEDGTAKTTPFEFDEKETVQ